MWLLIPAVAVIAGAIWARWTARRRVTHDGASLAGYERFRAAMEGPAGTPGRPSPAAGTAEAGTDRAAARPAPQNEEAASSGRSGRRRRVIVSGSRAKAAHTARTASAQTASEAGGEDSPKGPVAGSVP